MKKFLAGGGWNPRYSSPPPSPIREKVSIFDGWNDLIPEKFNLIKVTILKLNYFFKLH